MWILPNCNQFSRSAQASADSISVSDERFQALERSAMWRSKPSPARTWFRAWRKEPWMRHLFGRICTPSTAAPFVERWLASSVDIRASRSLLRASLLDQTTLGTSGPASKTSSLMFDLFGASSKTSPTICDSASMKSPETYRAWAIQLRQASLQRRKSARLTSENASSSLPWPTPIVNDSTGSQYSYSNGNHDRPAIKLPGAVKQWATWPTPTANCMTGAGTQGREGGMNLQTATATWASPTARDWKDGTSPGDVPTNGMLGRQAPRSGLHAPTAETGTASSSDGPNSPPPSSLYLNANFAEWLMGLPRNFTLPIYFGPTVSAPSATPSAPRKPRKRSARSQPTLPTHRDSEVY